VRWLVACVVSALACTAIPASAAGARGFSLGVTAGEVTSTSAQLWARPSKSGPYFLQLARGDAGGRCLRGPRVVARPEHDNTVQLQVRGLRPDTDYSYRFCSGLRSSETGHFQTAPAPSSTDSVRFGLTADLDGLYRNGRPAWNRFEVLGAMAREAFDFNVNLGDVIYADSVFRSPHAVTLAAKRAKYRLNLRYANFRRFRAVTGLYSHWDDHEFINDFSVPEYGRRLFRNGATAFRDYNPITYSRTTGIYRSFRWGANLEIFLLDLRSFRSASAGARGRCRNPMTGRPDIAPTLPASVRQRLAKYRPDLEAPVSKACTDAIADPGRTMLGSRQFQRFARDIQGSPAAFKMILSSVPVQQLYAFPLDRWEGYEPARQRFLRFLQQKVADVVFLSTDAHAAFTNEVYLRTLESGGPVGTGIREAIAGPVASLTYSGALGSAFAGRGFTTDLFKPPPPAGLGMSCAQPNVYSYADTVVTPTTLSITLKNDRGEPVTDLVTGAPCPPLVVER
jgi:phosphodiesterase/alkaline phosphatase D-like protein